MNRRLSIAKNHTATHLLQAALRKVLGEHVQQQGSLVAEDRLRFDFTHFKALTKEELDRTEELVNHYIKENLTVEIREMGIEEAKKSGALAFFGEKYEQRVRVVSAGSLSRELCGGTHLKNTARAGLFKIISESSIASGIRRIEAVTGDAAYKLVKEQEALLASVADTLKCRPDEILIRCQKLASELDGLNKRLSSLLAQKIEGSIDEIIDKAQDVKGAKLVIEQSEGTSVDILKETAEIIKKRLKENFVIFLVQAGTDKINMMLLVSDGLVKKGMNAGKLISDIAKTIGGSGGGRPNMASAGAKDISKIKYLLEEAREILTKEIR